VVFARTNPNQFAKETNLPAIPRSALVVLATVTLAAFLVLSQSPARAAAVKATFYACKDQAIFKKAFQRPAGKASLDAKDAKADSDAYFKSRISTGECLQLARGQDVSIDQRNGELWCVRPSGGLECYWTADKAIDLFPSTTTTMTPTAAGQSRRGQNH
jgi:hypothetical protein